MAMTSNRSYLIRAFYEWIVDNNCTPYIAVNALDKAVEVPQSYVADGQIVLNIAPRAVADLVMNNEGISFNARFGGIPTDIVVPTRAVMGIYAQENGQGIAFQVEDETDPEPSDPRPDGGGNKNPAGAAKSRLRVVK